MSDAAYLDQAVEWSKELTRLKSRGSSDTFNAMREVSRHYGIEYGFLWSLRYRRDRLRIISHSVYEALRAAYRAECAVQMEKLGNDLSKTEEVTGPNNPVVLAARSLLREALVPGVEVTKPK